MRIDRLFLVVIALVWAGPTTATAELREAWQSTNDLREWSVIVVHHSATQQGSVEAIHRHHRDVNGWDGIGYHFVIGNGRGMGDGEVVPTYRWLEQRDGAHAGVRAFNKRGIGICLIGHFGQAAPTEKQLAAFRELTGELSGTISLAEPRPIPHGRLKATACPGPFFPSDGLLPASAELPSIEIASDPEHWLAERQLHGSCDDVPTVATHIEFPGEPRRLTPRLTPAQVSPVPPAVPCSPPRMDPQ